MLPAVRAYLERIDVGGPCTPSPETLRRLHRAHVRSVPFENLDIVLGRPIDLDVTQLLDKIVTRRRGGFCYELNGLFGWLLVQLGFEVTLLSARVYDDDGVPGPEFDHLLLLVEAAGELLLADVGFGDSFVEPKPLRAGVYPERAARYRLSRDGDRWTLERCGSGGDWERAYVFSTAARQLEQFTEMCLYQQTSPHSSFTRRTLCTIATIDGRVTLSDGKLVVTSTDEAPGQTAALDERRSERPITGVDDLRATLRERFGVVLEPHELATLLASRGEPSV